MRRVARVEDVVEEALRLVKPSQEEVNAVNEVAKAITEMLSGEVRSLGLEGEVTLQGSIAHNTWLPGDRDIDVFIILPRNERYIDMVKSGELIRELANVLSRRGINWVMNYAQHPYLTLAYNGFNVDVVPCIRMSMGEKPITAADRSPLHTLYLRDRLRGLEDDVRLLKLMMKRIGVYGAEVKVQGFSGYLAELLTIAYGGFLNVVKAASGWVPFRVRISLTAHGGVRFNAPLVVIDPIDPNRNVAAAVSLDSMATFIAASRRLLKYPSMVFFRDVAPVPRPSVTAPTLVIYGDYPRGYVEDIVWGQLRSIASSIWNIVKRDGFKPVDIGLYTPQDRYVVIMITVEEAELPPLEEHVGPPVWTEESDVFISKYIDSGDVIGPFIRGGRWVVIRARRVRSIKDSVLRGLKAVGSGVVRDSLLRGEVKLISSVAQVSELPPEIRDSALVFMSKRPSWLTKPEPG